MTANIESIFNNILTLKGYILFNLKEHIPPSNQDKVDQLIQSILEKLCLTKENTFKIREDFYKFLEPFLTKELNYSDKNSLDGVLLVSLINRDQNIFQNKEGLLEEIVKTLELKFKDGVKEEATNKINALLEKALKADEEVTNPLKLRQVINGVLSDFLKERLSHFETRRVEMLVKSLSPTT